MRVSTRAEAAFLAIQRCNFTQSANPIVLLAAKATLRVEKSHIYDTGKSFLTGSAEKSATLSGAKVTERMSSPRRTSDPAGGIRYVWQTSEGPISQVSMPIFATRH